MQTIRRKSKMKPPKYEPLKMGEQKFANEYGKKMMRYNKWLNKQNNEYRIN